MRNDMTKIFHEPGRNLTSRSKRRTTLDIEATFEPMRRTTGASDHNYSPLRRYLTSQVGKPWNIVYSDICRSSPRRYTGQQLRDAVSYLVERDVQMIDGKPFDMNSLPITSNFSKVWVHPDTGILMRSPNATKPRPRYTPERTFEQIDIDQLHKLVLVNGIWFEVTFAVVPETIAEVAVPVKAFLADAAVPVTVYEKKPVVPVDILLDRAAVRFHGQAVTFAQQWGAEIYAISKRQAGKAQIKRYVKARLS